LLATGTSVGTGNESEITGDTELILAHADVTELVVAESEDNIVHEAPGRESVETVECNAVGGVKVGALIVLGIDVVCVAVPLDTVSGRSA
jgi:hypothetical protein